MDIDGGAAKAIKGTTQQITKLTRQKIKQVSVPLRWIYIGSKINSYDGDGSRIKMKIKLPA